jgi:hypothetical protein
VIKKEKSPPNPLTLYTEAKYGELAWAFPYNASIFLTDLLNLHVKIRKNIFAMALRLQLGGVEECLRAALPGRAHHLDESENA